MKLFNIMMSAALSLAGLAAAAAPEQPREKVILDTDMVEVFDDGIAMMLLAKSPNIDLLGVTVVAGNTWVPEGVAYGIRQLESIGETDIPLCQGVRLPIEPNRIDNIKDEVKLNGIGDGYLGSMGYAEPKSWRDFYVERYGEEPTAAPIDQHAVDFIIEQVHKNPNEVSILAIGTCCNLAMAVRKDPTIVPLIKRVIYMGGAFTVPGNTHPAAEFNWWYDPMAARIAVRSPFKEQMVVGLDVCNKVTMNKERYQRIIDNMKNPELAKMLRNNFLYSSFEKDPNLNWCVWDVIVAAIAVDPSILTEEMTRHIDVNAEKGISYGHSVAFHQNPPAGTQPARIVLDIDKAKFWTLIENLCQSL